MTERLPTTSRNRLFGQRLLAAARQRLAAGEMGDAERLAGGAFDAMAGDPAAAELLATVFHRQGRQAESETVVGAALDHPSLDAGGRARLLNLLGGIRRARGDHPASLAAFEDAITVDETLADAHANRAAALIALGRAADARASLDRALNLDPEHRQALNTAGVLLASANRLEAAVDCYRRAVRAGASDVDTLCNLGNALSRLDRLEEAEKAYSSAKARDPNHPRPLASLGKLAMDFGRLDEADGYYRAVLERVPDDADAHMSRGFIALLRGDFAAGWEGYQWRWRLPKGPLPPPEPRWQGEPLDGCTLLLQSEQGFGDTLQFVRYAQLAAARGAGVIVRCQRPLLRLLQTAPGVDTVIPDDGPLPSFDFAAAMLDLPALFGTTLESVPAYTPYLASPAVAPRLERILRDSMRMKVGLVWAGNRLHRNDRRRSLPADAAEALCQDMPVSFFSLQKPAPWLPPDVVDLGPFIEDFADTAAAIMRLDLVLSVDTAVAHLAGALGKPVWLLLPFAPDWRWMVGGDDSPWYPTMRLFRQESRGDWAGVVSRVRATLQAIAAQ